MALQFPHLHRNLLLRCFHDCISIEWKVSIVFSEFNCSLQSKNRGFVAAGNQIVRNNCSLKEVISFQYSRLLYLEFPLPAAQLYSELAMFFFLRFRDYNRTLLSKGIVEESDVLTLAKRNSFLRFLSLFRVRFISCTLYLVKKFMQFIF